MNIENITFGHICSKDILYYDSTVEEACVDICTTLNINYMPSIDGKSYFAWDNGSFVENRVEKDRKLSINDCILDERALEKFDSVENNVLFVYDREILEGVVHVCDYNQNLVLQALQDDLLSLERNLRKVLHLEEYSNKDIIDFCKYRWKKKNCDFWLDKYNLYSDQKDEMKNLGKFQLFYFNDLLHFAASSKSGKLLPNSPVKGEIDEIKAIVDVRNIAMHGKNPIEKNSQTSIYDVTSLYELSIKIRVIKEKTYRLKKIINDNPDHIKSIKMDNRSKLKIIHEHHPKALEYFLGNY